jgi:hypothetical protein
MEGSAPYVQLSLRIKKTYNEPLQHDNRTPTPKQKLKKVSFGSVKIFEFISFIEEFNWGKCGLHSPIQQKKPKKKRRFSI